MFDIQEPVQQIIRSSTYGWQTELMADVFSLASQNPFPPVDKWVALSRACLPIHSTLTNPVKREQSITKIEQGAKVLVGFSGGKDSTAAALKIKAAGATPILFYTRGINKAYPGEENAARLVAEKLGLKLIINQVHVSGGSDYVENPVKNQFILATMVDYGYGSNIHEFAQGNLLCDTVSEYNISYGFSDCREMYQAVEPIMAEEIGLAFKFHYLLEDDTDSLTTIINTNPSVLPFIQSCMTPVRYRGKLHNDNIKKYGVALMENRCGSCYKCAVEWLHLDYYREQQNSPAFASHCIDMMVRGLERALGKKVTRAESVPHFFSGEIQKYVSQFV